MRAIVYRHYGSPDVLKLEDLPKPGVAGGEALIRVHAASVNPVDGHFVTGRPLVVRTFSGIFRPRRPILGADIAGTVEAVGSGVTSIRPGDAVFGTTDGSGSFAEYASVPAAAVVPKPAHLDYEEAAAAPVAALTALQGLRDKGRIQAGQSVLIHGASGGVGTYAVQIAKSFGTEVTGVCSTPNVELVRSLGADHILDYTRDDFTRTGSRFDLILDLVGNRQLPDCRRTLTAAGIYVAIAGAPSRALWVALAGGRRMVWMITQPNQTDLESIRSLLETGRIRSVIDRRYSLREVPEAIRYVAEGHARGKVVIAVESAS